MTFLSNQGALLDYVRHIPFPPNSKWQYEEPMATIKGDIKAVGGEPFGRKTHVQDISVVGVI